ncbi:glycosyltransferase family 4 protein [Anthocerotibacter panamensis]|uniref:glycosyltransferase family 4 protein n=1 Tax=Anthocerotibacter panamensis TaxID=2857077 RepID=UPI001C40884A|nr:glycosyltransferase family 4 protein [Anthocerotibacter panamensis]
MRILHILNDLHNLGNGIVNHVVDLAIAQQASGHRVTVLSSGGEHGALLAAHGVTLTTLLMNRTLWLQPLHIVQALQTINHQIAHFDIVHAHMMSGLLLAYSGCLRQGIPLIASMHNSWQHHARLMRLADHLIAGSQAVAQQLFTWGVKPDQVSVVANGTGGTYRYQALPAAPVSALPAGRRVLTVAGLFDRKGIHILLEAVPLVAAVVPQVRFCIVGDGPDRARYQQKVQEAGIGLWVTFLGFRPRFDNLLPLAELLVHPPLADPAPLVIPETLAAGIPIVGTSVGGIPEALAFGQAGLLVPPGNPQALASAVLQVLTDPTLAATLQLRSQERAACYTTQAMAAQTVAVYEKVLTRAVYVPPARPAPKST